MPLPHFTVTQVRTAAACPRILYFDAARTQAAGLKQPAVTRVWKTGRGDEGTACGTLFHATVEDFNRQAAADPVVRQLPDAGHANTTLAQELLAHVYRHHVNREALFQKPAAQQQAFLGVLGRYLGELADILVHARGCGKQPGAILDEMFGDKRRRAD